MIKRVNISYTPDLDFTLVGKSSPAHLLAAKVGTKKVKPDRIISLEDITELLWPQEKIGYSVINRTEGNLTQDWIPGGRKPSRSNKENIAQKRKKVKKKDIIKT